MPEPLELATIEELISELYKRSEALVLGVVIPASGAGASGARETIFEFKESAPFQALGFSKAVEMEALSWNDEVLAGNDAPREDY